MTVQICPNGLEVDRGHRSHDFETILAQHGVEGRYYYWAVKCLAFGTENDIVFGFVKKDSDGINFNQPILDNRSFIGLLPGSGMRWSNRQQRNCVMEPCSHGLEIGLLLKMGKDDKKKGSLMLFVEGRFQDYIEEKTVAPGLYFPVVSLQNSGHEVRFTTV